MTLNGALRAIGLKEFHIQMRSLVEGIATHGGDPCIILDRGEPVAILISFEEADRYARAEAGLAMLRGRGVYAELAEGLDQLPEIIRGTQRVSESAKRELNLRHRPITGYLSRIASMTTIRPALGKQLEKVAQGDVITIAGRDRNAATLISSAEFERLRALRPIIGWFRSQGLDLSSAETEDIDAFVTSFRGEARPGARPGAGRNVVNG
jgi:prevent-host-death family protein